MPWSHLRTLSMALALLCALSSTALAQEEDEDQAPAEEAEAVADGEEELPDPATIQAEPVSEEAPITIALIDVTNGKKNSAAIKKKLLATLRENKKLKVDEVDLGDLKPEELRTGEGRQANKEPLAEAIRTNTVELIILMDAYGRGRNLQLVLIGDDGGEVAEIKRKLRRKRKLGGKEAQAMAKKAAEEGTPAVEARREEVAAAERARVEAEIARREEERRKAEAAAAAAEAEAAEEGVSASTRTRPEGSAIRRVSVGGLIGQRVLNMTGAGVVIDQTLPMAGAGGEVTYRVPVANDLLRVGGTLGGAWAPLALDFNVDETTTEQLRGHFVEGDLHFDGDVLLGRFVEIGVDLGARITSITLDQNALYTGHRYVWGRAGGVLVIKPIPMLRLEGGAAALPVVQALTSGDAYGEAQSQLGLEFGGALRLALSNGVGAALVYQQIALDQEYQLGGEMPGTVTATDSLQRGYVMLSYAF